MVGKALRIPVVHTYHTQYEDYVSYIANGKIIRPSMVKPLLRGYLKDLDGVIRPSRIVLNLLEGYEVTIPKRVDRKSTRLNSSHANISYAVFCLKKKKTRIFTAIANT